MAPTPKELPEDHGVVPEVSNGTLDGDRIVISGVSGAYPQSRNIKELSEVLYNKVNPISENNLRWDYNHPEVPKYAGLIPDLDTFDAQFFKVHYRLGVNMDPMSRKILEHTYQAIFDAGVNPNHLSGKKVGVYIGTCLSETEKSIFYGAFPSKTGLGIAGCNKSMFANRVSYWLNAKGPSLAIDAACCSSTVALEQAYQAMTRGVCEAAVVGGCHLCLHPQTSIHFGRNIPLCKDGKTKSYNQTADGCVRSEAVSVIFLQKAKDAFRVYADVVYVKSKYVSAKNSGTFMREPEEIVGFLKEFYNDVKISPRDVEYIEGFGAAEPGSDKMELEAIDEVFCPGRNEPLYVGSVMSNLGYAEAASGISAVTKVILGYHRGELAGNLHCSSPRTDVAALREGRIKILDDHRHINRSYIAVNGLSITGLNSHVLLHGHYKPKDLTKYQCDIPRLVLISGRTDSAVQNLINDLKSRPIDAEELALIQNIHSAKVSGHLGRGFAVLDTDNESKTTSLCEKSEYYDGSDRPLWFVYSGMGSQWAEMGAQLMRIPIFAGAIERCRKVLEPKGIDIVHIITTPDKTIFDNILHSFVGIAAVQIGLTDVLLQLGLVPDKIIGHSVGELGCAYADGCLTAEEMILAAYSRGLVSIQTPFIRGSMAAVGIGFEEVSRMCPPEIEVACHNASNSSTISGPADIMAEFVAQLTAKGIFAKEVPCSNIAYHSRYIAEAGPGLLKYLQDVIKTPKLRSERWVSTSVPQERWNEDLAKYSSAEYHTNNLLSPVLFDETSRLIPRNAVVVEVAPHGLLQAILKRSLTSCTHVPLTRRGHLDNARFLLEAIGTLFMEGYYPDIRALYPKIEFPVSTGTPQLSHFVDWVHQEKWFLAHYASPERISTATCTFKISLHDPEYSYLQGNQIKGKTVYPFASALVAVWDTLAMTLGTTRKKLSVQFCNIQLHTQPIIHDSRLLRLNVALHRGNGWFEVNDDITKVVSGYIYPKKTDPDFTVYDNETNEKIKLKTKEVYQILNERGYMYRNVFRSIYDANASFQDGRLSWMDNWAAFFDGMLQLNALRQPHDGVSQPAFIRHITISTDVQGKEIEIKKLLNVKVCTVNDFTRCGGVIMEGIRYRNITKTGKSSLVLNTSILAPEYPVGALNGKNKESSRIRKVLKSSCVGNLDSLHWIEAPALDGDGISVKVHFAGLNASDIMKAYGELPPEKHYASESCYGMDFSGTMENGARVMGLVRSGAVSECVRARPELLWPVPEHWSLEDAATVPFAYAHAYYCLATKMDLHSNSAILVSSGAGATGQAVINLALYSGCRVFVVVGDAKKKRFLLKMFPKLNADDVVCCRDDTFVDRVLTATNGRRCEYVICGRGDLKNAYMNCCANWGYTLDIHQVKRNDNYTFGLAALNFERGVISADFSSIFQHGDVEIFKKLQRMVSTGISSGAVRPLSRACFAPHDATRAFRLLAAGANRGRVLLRIHSALPPFPAPRIICSANRSQLLISDDEGLAIHLADRLVRRGARLLHLQVANTSERFVIAQQSWRKLGVNVTTSSEDLAKNESASNLVKQSLKLGLVEGVFVVVAKPTDQTQKIYNSLVSTLDAETRKCSTIKYFGVIGINNSVGEKICVSRATYKLPAMLLSIPIQLKDEIDAASLLSASYSDIVSATEQGLRTLQPVIFAHRDSIPQESLSQQIENIVGIPISESTHNTQTLLDLGITKEKAVSLYIFLRDSQNVLIDEKEVPLLTVEKIKEMETVLKESDYSPIEGLKAYFPYVDKDELMVMVECVGMPTLTISGDMRDDEFDASQIGLFIIPGLQGLHQRYKTLCERLKIAANVLQPGIDNPNESIEQMTAKYAKRFLKNQSENDKFYLLGHELGVISALEMAAILEDHGLTGTVFCVGGGPDEILTELELQLQVACGGAVTESALQQAVARHMCSLMRVASPELDEALRDATTWPQRVEVVIRALRGRVAYSAQYVRLIIESAYARIEQARRYASLRAQAAPRALRSRVVLLRSTAVMHSLSSLQRYSRHPLAVHDLRAPLSRSADDLRVAAVVNQYLDEETLENFAKKSLCFSYLMNSGAFIGNDAYTRARRTVKHLL